MTELCGKGIWLTHSYDLQRAVEMATQTEATHLLVKVGHGPHYYPEIAPGLLHRVRSLGFRALAWVHITDRAPEDAFQAIRRALILGYDRVILFLGKALITQDQVQPLVDKLEPSELPFADLLLATPPLLHLPDRQALDMLAPLCLGGWMPLCFPSWNKDAEQMIHQEVYQSISDLSLLWGATPSIYPVLSPSYGKNAPESFLPEALIPWAEAILEHGVDFYSIYHAAATEKACWPILQATNVACESERLPVDVDDEPAPSASVPQPEYVTATANDTVWVLIRRYGMTKEQFWRWNGHLWDSRGLPRDSDYLRAGWRVRVK